MGSLDCVSHVITVLGALIVNSTEDHILSEYDLNFIKLNSVLFQHRHHNVCNSHIAGHVMSANELKHFMLQLFCVLLLKENSHGSHLR